MFSSNPKKDYSIRVHDESNNNVIILKEKFYYSAVYILYLILITIVPYGAYRIIDSFLGGYDIGTSNLKCEPKSNGKICEIIDNRKGISSDN